MKYVKGKIAALLLGTPIAFLAACYGPAPFYYSCANDHHCRQFPNGKCDIHDCKDSAGNKGGYCEYPGYKQCGGYPGWQTDSITYVPEGQDCPDPWSRNDSSSDANSDGASE